MFRFSNNRFGASLNDLAYLIFAFVFLCSNSVLSAMQLGDENNKTQVGQGITEDRLAELVKDLGSEDFEARERATKELQRIGEPAIPALKLAIQSKDREVRTRAEQLLKAIEEKVRKTITLNFMRETDPNQDYGMKGWRYAAKQLGTSRKAKELFLEMYQAEPKLLALLEENPQLAVTEVANLGGRISASVMAGADAQVGETGILLLAMYLPEVQSNGTIHDAIKTGTFSGAYKRLMMLETGETPARKLFGHWLTLVNEANASRAMLIAREVMAPESAVLARRMLEKELDDGDSTVAISLIMLFGDKTDVPLLEKLLKDETELDRFEVPTGFGGAEGEGLMPRAKATEPIPLEIPGRPRPVPPPGNPPGNGEPAPAKFKLEVFTTQRRDLALAALLFLAGQDLKRHFPLMGPSQRRGITTNDAAFPESKPELRANALKAWESVREGYLSGDRK